MHVLRRTLEGAEPGATVLDLQVIRPNPRIEAAGRVVAEIDGEPLFRKADAAAAAIDSAVAAGRLVDEAVDEHDVRTHFANGSELADYVAETIRSIPEEAAPTVRAIAGGCAIADRCRLRRLRLA